MQLVLTDRTHKPLIDGTYAVEMAPDGAVRIADAPAFEMPKDGIVNAHLILKQENRVLAKNHYHDILSTRPPVRGRNQVMHEQGLRAYEKE